MSGTSRSLGTGAGRLRRADSGPRPRRPPMQTATVGRYAPFGVCCMEGAMPPPAALRRGVSRLVGPPGIEPGTDGFADSRGFPRARTISSPAAAVDRDLVNRGWGAGRSSLSSRALGVADPRQPPGSLCTFRRCTAGLAQGCRGFPPDGFPEFIPFIRRFSAPAHQLRKHRVTTEARTDESTALTN